MAMSLPCGLYQPAADLGQHGPVGREVRDRVIGEGRDAVEQVTHAHRVGPVGQSGGDAGARARLGERRREAARREAPEQRIEGREPLRRPVAPLRIAEGQVRVHPLNLEVRHGGERGEKTLGRLQRHAEPPEAGIDLDVDRCRSSRRRGTRSGVGARPVDHRRHQPGADEVGHPRRQGAREHDHRRVQPLRFQPAGFVEGTGHERREPVLIGRAGHGQGAVAVGVGLQRHDAPLIGADAAADRGEVRPQPIQVVNRPAGLRVVGHAAALLGLSPSLPRRPARQSSDGPAITASGAKASISLTTSITAGRPAVKAVSSAPRMSAGFSTRRPSAPMLSATVAKFTSL